MILLLALTACTLPPIIDPVEGELADRVVNKASASIRYLTAVAGVLAEGCGQPSSTLPDQYFFSPLAQAMGIKYLKPTVDDSGSTVTWSFKDVGLDGQTGTLTIQGTPSGASFNAVYIGNGGTTTMQTQYSMIECTPRDVDPAGPVAPPAKGGTDTGGTDTGGSDTGGTDTGGTDTGGKDTGGTDTGDTGGTDTGDTGDTGKDTGDSGTDTGTGTQQAVMSAVGVFIAGTCTDCTFQIALKGSPPYAGLAFSPKDAAAPTGGYATWLDESTKEELILDDASTITAGGTTWGGTASDTTWTRTVQVPLP